MSKILTPKQQLFIREFSRSQNLFQAAQAAGVPPYQEYEQAMLFMDDPDVREAIKQAIAKKKPKVLPEQVVDKLWKIALADPRELVKTTRICCRCCWGKEFRYQRTPWQYHLHIEAGGKEDGGSGYDPRRPPNPDCPECFGKGQIVTEVPPLEELSENALALVAGITVLPNGLRVRVHNQLKALELIGKHLGMFSQRLHITESLHEDMRLQGEIGLDKAQEYNRDMQKTGQNKPRKRPPTPPTEAEKAATREHLAKCIQQNTGRPPTQEELQHLDEMLNTPPREEPVPEGKPPITYQEWNEQRDERDTHQLTDPLPYSHHPIHIPEHPGPDPPQH